MSMDYLAKPSGSSPQDSAALRIITRISRNLSARLDPAELTRRTYNCSEVLKTTFFCLTRAWPQPQACTIIKVRTLYYAWGRSYGPSPFSFFSVNVSSANMFEVVIHPTVALLASEISLDRMRRQGCLVLQGCVSRSFHSHQLGR